jgi:hypothetical protein
MPFFPRVLKHFVGFRDSIRQGGSLQGLLGQGLQTPPHGQKFHAIHLQFSGQLGGGNALSDAAQDQPDLRRGTPCLVQHGSCPGIENAVTVPALIIHNRSPMPPMDTQTVVDLATRTSQPVGVQQLDQLGVAGTVIHNIEKGEIHTLPP